MANIVFKDAKVKEICVQNWGSNGEITYEQAAAVTDLWGKFKENKTITSFDELQYFTGLQSIADEEFYNCSSLTSIIIPSKVTSIGDRGFSGCSALTSIVIPSNVKTIGNYAFQLCTGLTSLTIEEGVTKAGTRAFYWCAMTSVVIPSTLTSLGDDMFKGCSKLTSITINAKWTTIPSGMFMYCSSLTSITIPETVTSIGQDAFASCSSLSSVTALRIQPVTIGTLIFYGLSDNCTLTVPKGTRNAYIAAGWTEEIFKGGVQEIDDTIHFADPNVKAICVQNWGSDGEITYDQAAAVTSIGTVFSGNTTITSFDELKYFTGLTAIEDKAFYGCSALTSIVIPEGVTEIKGSQIIYHGAFSRCTSLSSVSLPSTLRTIGIQSFALCSALNSIKLPDGLLRIEALAFNLAGITSITFPNSLTYIGTSAFNSSHLTSVTIPDSVTELGVQAFANCDYLDSAIIGNGVTTIPKSCFGYSVLTSVTIGNNVTKIDSDAFAACRRLTSLYIPANVQEIVGNPFLDCGGLTSIVVDAKNNFYNSHDNCNAIIKSSSNTLITGCQNTVILDTVREIGEDAFHRVHNLTSVTIPESVEIIRESAFYECTGLTSVTVEGDISILESSVFENCRALKTVRFKGDVRQFGGGVFFGCTALEDVYFDGTLSQIGSYVYSPHDSNVVNFWFQQTTAPTVGENFWKDGYAYVWPAGIPAFTTAFATNPGIIVVERLVDPHVTYLYDDGTEYLTQMYDLGDPIVPPADPVKRGHTFTGWTPPLPATLEVRTLIETATFSVNQYTIYWSDDAGSHETKFDYDSVISLPVQPRTGYSYHFNPALPEKMPDEDLTTTVVYTINKYTVYWTDDAGSHETKFYYNSPVSIEPQARRGYSYHFNPALPDVMPANDITTTVVYTINQYTIYWSDDAGSHETKFDYDSVISLSVQPRLGYEYHFDPALPEKMPDEDLTTTVVYTPKYITLTFIVDDAVYATVGGHFGEEVTKPEAPEKPDIQFAGWSPRCPKTFPPDDLTLTALFLNYVERVEQLPVFREKLLNASTGEIRPGNKLEITLGDAVYDVEHGRYVQPVYVAGQLTNYRVFCQSPTEENVDVSLPLLKDGKYFTINWFAERTSDGQIMTLGEQVTYASYYAEITGVNLIGPYYYEEILTADGTYTGNRVDLLSKVFTQSTEDASDWTLLWTFTGILKTIEEETPVKELNFKEIQISKTGTRTETIITPDSSSWLYHYRYVPELFTSTDFALFTSDFRAKLLADKTDSTHYIQSVKVNLSEGYEWTVVEKSTDDVTVNVRIFDGEDLYSVMAGIPGSPFIYETPVKAGYTFDRLDPDLQVYPNKDTDVQAIFTEIPVPEPEPEKVHTLTAIVEGAVYATAKVEELTSTAGLIADPIVPGKRFTGWSPEIPATMPKNDLTVTAQFTASGGTFTLTYQVDSSTYKTYQVKAGASVPVQPYPTKALYEFSGWTGVPEVMPAQNVTVTGSFTSKRTEVYPGEPKRRTITYIINHQESDAKNSTSVYRVEYHVAGDAITKLALPVKENYSFSAWSGFPANNVMPNADVVVTTTQTDAKQLAKFYVDGSLKNTTENVVGEKITLPSTPVKSGYTFRYWANCPTYQPAETVTATAVFVKNE